MKYKKIIIIGLVIVLILLSLSATILFSKYISDKDKSIVDQLRGLKTNYALVIPSQSIDEYPLWSDDSKFIYAVIEGEWMKLDLKEVHLSPAVWHGDIILGVNDNIFSLKPAEESSEKINNLILKNKNDLNSLILPDGTKLKFNDPGLSSSLSMAKPGQQSESLWSTDLESCYYLILSPNKRYVLFKCEMNGIFLMDVTEHSIQ